MYKQYVNGIEYSARALQDEVKDLPGIPDNVNFKQFSGYVDLPSGNGKVFYWYVESQNDPDSDPLLWWTNGGPGCSGLSGFLTEQGPFAPNVNLTLGWNLLSVSLSLDHSHECYTNKTFSLSLSLSI